MTVQASFWNLLDNSEMSYDDNNVVLVYTEQCRLSLETSLVPIQLMEQKKNFIYLVFVCRLAKMIHTFIMYHKQATQCMNNSVSPEISIWPTYDTLNIPLDLPV